MIPQDLEIKSQLLISLGSCIKCKMCGGIKTINSHGSMGACDIFYELGYRHNIKLKGAICRDCSNRVGIN